MCVITNSIITNNAILDIDNTDAKRFNVVEKVFLVKLKEELNKRGFESQSIKDCVMRSYIEISEDENAYEVEYAACEVARILSERLDDEIIKWQDIVDKNHVIQYYMDNMRITFVVS